MSAAVRRYIAARRARERIFGADLFADPAWDILLDLFAAENAGQRISVSSACIAASVPPTTALRCISILEERGLVIREQDTRDRRRAFLCLSPEARDGFRRFFGVIDEMAIDPIELTLAEGRPADGGEARTLRDIIARIRELVS